MPNPFDITDDSTGKRLWSCDFNGNTDQIGNALVRGNLAVTGTTTSTGAQTFNGNVTVGGNLSVTGTTTMTGNAQANGTLGVSGLLTPSSGVNLPGVATPSTPGTSAVLYANSLFLPAAVTPSGLIYTLSGNLAAVTSTTTIANSNTLTALQSFTVPANDPSAGAVYEMTGYGVFSVTATPTLTFALYWGGTGGTQIAAVPAITAASGITSAPFWYDALVTFRSTTSVTAAINLSIDTSAVTDAASTFVATPTAPTAVTTTGANALAMGFTWSAQSSSNTISLLGGTVKRVA